ncbi:HesA/MoeB/ThiF family protein [Acidimangrovimonas sediminis]|uniref:HesA/MoeB/ThiF family protein n=1 Tax=Acidimangrovimonas sediminis TaxID=2056283 RepID=UPI000C7FBE89|nr:HesA/MoeB/ThiF family protein [Acidimangrovimonas sediminis]
MSRYDRQAILPEVGADGQARLAAAHVLVVGAGGLGATVLPALAGAGIGRIRILDPDRVEESNLHRQTLYRMDDLGQHKADCAARELTRLNPACRVEPVAARLTAGTAAAMLDGVGLVIDAADSFAVTYILSDLCRDRRIPLIAASVLGRAGHAGGFCGTAPSYRALFPDLPSSAASCATAGVMGPAVAAVGALQAQMALGVLLGHAPSPLGQCVTLDLAQWRFASFRFDGAPEPGAGSFPFLSPDALASGDTVVELRDTCEAPVPVVPGALRLSPGQVTGWQPPPGRVVLCCRSGVRAWRAAQVLAARGHGALAVLAEAG